VRLSANYLCPERRSDDGQTILECIRMGLKSCPELVLLVELSGLEPLTSCMPSHGSTSTRVYPCRSPSSRVPASPPASAPVAVLSCCTAARPARQTGYAYDRCVTSQNLTSCYRCPARQTMHPLGPPGARFPEVSRASGECFQRIDPRIVVRTWGRTFASATAPLCRGTWQCINSCSMSGYPVLPDAAARQRI
jgi:hypothetical protein